TLLRSHIDNGYDAWSVDNTWRSQSDRPGVDTQRATAASVRLETSAWSPGTFTVVGSYAKSNSVNSYDGDWGNAQLWAPYTYDFCAGWDRHRTPGGPGMRLASAAPRSPGDIAGRVGAYGLRMTEGGHDTNAGVYVDPFVPANSLTTDDFLTSRYHATNAAVFG